jgi:hypothetical protein
MYFVKLRRFTADVQNGGIFGQFHDHITRAGILDQIVALLTAFERRFFMKSGHYFFTMADY